MFCLSMYILFAKINACSFLKRFWLKLDYQRVIDSDICNCFLISTGELSLPPKPILISVQNCSDIRRHSFHIVMCQTLPLNGAKKCKKHLQPKYDKQNCHVISHKKFCQEWNMSMRLTNILRLWFMIYFTLSK